MTSAAGDVSVQGWRLGDLRQCQPWGALGSQPALKRHHLWLMGILGSGSWDRPHFTGRMLRLGDTTAHPRDILSLGAP